MLQKCFSAPQWSRNSYKIITQNEITNYLKWAPVEKFFNSFTYFSICSRLGVIPLRVAEYMDTSTQLIVHMEVVDSREVDRGISFLVNRLPFFVWEVVRLPDASRTMIYFVGYRQYK